MAVELDPEGRSPGRRHGERSHWGNADSLMAMLIGQRHGELSLRDNGVSSQVLHACGATFARWNSGGKRLPKPGPDEIQSTGPCCRSVPFFSGIVGGCSTG